LILRVKEEGRGFSSFCYQLVCPNGQKNDGVEVNFVLTIGSVLPESGVGMLRNIPVMQLQPPCGAEEALEITHIRKLRLRLAYGYISYAHCGAGGDEIINWDSC